MTKKEYNKVQRMNINQKIEYNCELSYRKNLNEWAKIPVSYLGFKLFVLNNKQYTKDFIYSIKAENMWYYLANDYEVPLIYIKALAKEMGI